MTVAPTRTLTPLVVLAMTVCLLLVGSPAFAQADDDAAPPRLGVAPVDLDASWFDLEVDAGESTDVVVEFANHGGVPTDAWAYIADAYTLINGGMGVGLRNDPVQATGTWVALQGQNAISLDAETAVHRTLTVSVPAEVGPGQYLAAVVIESDQPLGADGDLGMNRVVRQAIAVNITVPGPATPSMVIGAADYSSGGSIPVVRLTIDNTGNRHLRPHVSLLLTDGAGNQVGAHDVAMDTVYAFTATQVELRLAEPLPAGDYTIAVDLEDSNHAVAASATANVNVAATQAPPSPSLAERIEQTYSQVPVAGTYVVGAGLLLLLVLGIVLLRRGRVTPAVQRTSPLADRPAPSRAVSSPSTPSAPARPRPRLRPGHVSHPSSTHQVPDRDLPSREAPTVTAGPDRRLFTAR